jgi:3-oxoacyl-[acyl-carrier protein] reductase
MEAGRRFENKVALVTGGGSGSRLGCGLRLVAEGAAVAIADIDADRPRDVRREIESQGEEALGIACDVAEHEHCRPAVQATVDAFGRPDILITSAGVDGGGRTVVDTPAELFDYVVGVDLKSAYLAAEFAVSHIRDDGGGAVVQIALIGGLRS